MVILIANDVESNPGPYLDLSIQYANDYLYDRDYDSQIIKEHVDKILTLQSNNYQIPTQYLTDENVLLWSKVKSKANRDDAFDDFFCQNVHRIWSYWDTEAFNKEFPQVANTAKKYKLHELQLQENTRTTTQENKRTTSQENTKTPTTRKHNFPVSFPAEVKKEAGDFKYEHKENAYICLVLGCPRRMKPMKDRETLKNHARRDHSLNVNLKKGTSKRAEPFTCLQCGKAFTRLQTLTKHQDNLKCQIGGEGWVNQTADFQNLISHQATSQLIYSQAKATCVNSVKTNERTNMVSAAAAKAGLVQDHNELGNQISIPEAEATLSPREMVIDSREASITATGIQIDVSNGGWSMEDFIMEQEPLLWLQQNEESLETPVSSPLSPSNLLPLF